VDKIDVDKKQVVVSHGFDHHSHALEYDQLVLALGSVTNFFNLPGVAERALTMKSLGEAIQLRNRLIAHLNQADTECARAERSTEPSRTLPSLHHETKDVTRSPNSSAPSFPIGQILV
jgi:NADH dehydrogenase